MVENREMPEKNSDFRDPIRRKISSLLERGRITPEQEANYLNILERSTSLNALELELKLVEQEKK